MRCSVFWIASILGAAPVVAQAETFLLNDGAIIEGTVLRSLGNTLTIKHDDGGMYQLPLGIVGVAVGVVDDGGLVTGSLAWWAAGTYVVVTGEGLVEIKDGVINKVSDIASSPNSIIDEPSPEPELDGGQNVEAPAPAAKSLINEQARKKIGPTM